MVNKNCWHKLFNKNIFSYSASSQINSKDYKQQAYDLAKVIYPNLDKKKYNLIITFIKKNLDLKKNKSILDFGSGNGSFLYYFINKYNLSNNYSFEISKPLIKFQKKFIRKTFFFKTQHLNLRILSRFNKSNILVDYSMMNSVAQYFYNNYYFEQVIEFLIHKTKKKILIYDIKNHDLKFLYKETVRMRQNLSKRDFNKKYKNTPIRFYKKLYIKKFLEKIKKKYVFDYSFIKLPQSATDHKFGFCLLIEKKNIK